MISQKLEYYQNLSFRDLEAEEWKDISGLEGLYQISNLGRIKNLGRELIVERPNDSYITILAPRIMKQFFGKQKQAIVRLKGLEEKAKTYHVPQLVAKHFIDNPNNYLFVFHKDSQKRFDNSVSNLYWENTDGFSLPYGQSKEVIYKGVSKRRDDSKQDGKERPKKFSVTIKINGRAIFKEFKTALEGAKFYDSIILQYDLRRKGNFLDNRK